MRLASGLGAGAGALRSAVALAAVALLAGSCTAGPAAGPDSHDRASSLGSDLWIERYNGPANGTDQAASIAVSPDGGRVFVTGRSQGTNHKADYATVAYSTATGAQKIKRLTNKIKTIAQKLRESEQEIARYEKRFKMPFSELRQLYNQSKFTLPVPKRRHL